MYRLASNQRGYTTYDRQNTKNQYGRSHDFSLRNACNKPFKIRCPRARFSRCGQRLICHACNLIRRYCSVSRTMQPQHGFFERLARIDTTPLFDSSKPFLPVFAER